MPALVTFINHLLKALDEVSHRNWLRELYRTLQTLSEFLKLSAYSPAIIMKDKMNLEI